MDILTSLITDAVESSSIKQFFSNNHLSTARKLILNSKVNLSFQKGGLEKYLIISGIIHDNYPQEAKFTYKDRLKDSSEGPVGSFCNCPHWNEEHHCQHVASLFLQYLINELRFDRLNTSNKKIESAHQRYRHGGVYPLEYGTIIKSPKMLQGAPSASTYSSLQYQLHDLSTVNLPTPSSLEGKLLLSFESNESQNIIFKYQDLDGNIFSEISIFEHIYIFNWVLGKLYHLPNELKPLIKRINREQSKINLEHLLLLNNSLKEKNLTELEINNKILSEVNTEESNSRVVIQPSEKKNYLDISISFFSEENQVIPPPIILKELCFDDGSLSTFSRKKDAYEFIECMINSFSNNQISYTQKLLRTHRKEYLESIISSTQSSEQTYHYLKVEDTDHVYTISNELILKFISSIHSNFGEMIFRFARFNPNDLSITYSATYNSLFQGLSKFQKDLSILGTTFYYDKKEISYWPSKISFERRESSTGWFNLELNINDIDLDIINQANIETGIAITTDGLVLLSNEQKDLLRVMRRYVQYEKDSVEKEVTPDEQVDINKFIIPFKQIRIFELFELKKLGIEGALTEEEIKLCNTLSNLKEMPQYQLPETLKDVLRPYQKDGFNWLRFLYDHKLGACLADDMGLGKTLQTIAFLQDIYDSIDKVLIVCPVTILINWQDEFNKFSNIKTSIYHGNERELCNDTKIILTSYGVMKKEASLAFKDMNFDVIILDEVQYLKNIRTIGSIAARNINAKFRVCLTGTPVENDLAEFYNILDLSVPGIWGDLQFIRTKSNKKSRLLAKKTAAPFILRRTKNQVLTDLPPKIENNIMLEMSPEEKTTYASTLVDIKHRINTAQSRKKYGEILRGLLKLRQSCLWQYEQETLNKKSFKISEIASTKINFLLSQLEQILEEGHQALVFSQFTTYLDIIQKFIAERHWKISRIDGTQTTKKRHEQVERFQSSKSSVFLISLRAGGIGLNLTAASYVFIMDPWWNPAVENQAIDRAHRIGQENTLNVYRPIIKGSVEEKVLKLQEVKKQLFYDLLSTDDESFTGKLTMKDFEMLLQE
ncbi:MAG: DEAD/DEAH box helicase [Bdellovibrionales bacterium]|nr:DEAD/DEAH box helicase [Bdellovibrionales bacterium]